MGNECKCFCFPREEKGERNLPAKNDLNSNINSTTNNNNPIKIHQIITAQQLLLIKKMNKVLIIQ